MRSPTLQIDHSNETEKSNSFIIPLNKYISKFFIQWDNCDNSFPNLQREYSVDKKLVNKNRLDNILKSLNDNFNTFPKNSKDQTAWKNRLFFQLRHLFEDVLEFSSDSCDLIFNDTTTKASSDFLSAALKFNPDLTKKEIYQAMRNVWIMNTIQLFLCKPVEKSLSIHAYSLLYPYSDNLIDDPKLSEAEKIKFHKRFGSRLKGKIIKPLNNIERDIYKLVETIEQQYSRNAFPQVWASLYAIHEAQQKSLKQQNNKFLSEEEILKISIEKGGSSVLADAYLIDPSISEETAEFMFGFGVLLQFADDLQDVGTDKQNGHMTIFCSQKDEIPLDERANKLFHFMNKILGDTDLEPSDHYKPIKYLICDGYKQLLIRSIYKNKYYFSDKYVIAIEKFSSYPFSYSRQIGNRMNKLISKINLKKGVFGNSVKKEEDISFL